MRLTLNPMSKQKAFLVTSLLFLSTTIISATDKKDDKNTPAKPAHAPASQMVLDTMQAELDRGRTELAKADPSPYFISYTVNDRDSLTIAGSQGTILNSQNNRSRFADVSMRIGTPELDNTHNESRPSALTSGSIPLIDDKDAIARVLWQLTEREYRKASRSFENVKTSKKVRAKEEDESPDFSKEQPSHDLTPEKTALSIEQKKWEERVRKLSATFRNYVDIERSVLVLEVEDGSRYFVSTEGSRIESGGHSARIMALATSRAEDGMELLRVETFSAESPDKLPSDTEIIAKIKKMGEDLAALKKAPIAEPFSGPSMLSGRAAAVFFHEVLGHRLEGQRQRGDEEGQTFTKRVNQEVLPTFLSVADDPTRTEVNGIQLSGTYKFDDEGVPSRPVQVIKDGVLKEFLMSRMPVKNFSQSNGHGRNQPGLMAVGRQGNLIVTSTKSLKDSEVRARLIEEVKKAGKPYGLYFDDIQGGFTLTQRALPQAFQVLPIMVYRVYADGRPDELVRGVDIVGTPLTALTRIEITGDKPEVFNGICGAESGSVPVSAVAPSMLFSEIEVQRKQQSHELPPILPPPGFEPPPGKDKKETTKNPNGGAL